MKTIGLITLIASGLSGALLVACGGKVVFDTGNGGAGGDVSQSIVATSGKTSVTSGKTTSAKASVTVGSSAEFMSTGSVGDCQANCEAQHPQGFDVLTKQIVHQCGCTGMSPCLPACMQDQACVMPPSPPTGPCAACIQQEAQKGAASACSLAAATGITCQSEPDCTALVTCILSCP